MKKSMLLALCLSVAAILPGCHGDKTETKTTKRMTDRNGKTMREEKTTTRRDRRREDKDMRNRNEGKQRTKKTYQKTERSTRNEM